MNNLIVMYHYVRDGGNFKAFSSKDFKKQVQYLKEKYRIISLKELIEEKPKDKTCVLTFDDGIKDGFINVLPILEEQGVKASFFIPTRILEEKELLAVQKRHLLLAKLGTEAFIEEFNALVNRIFQIKKEGNKNNCDDLLTSNLKYVLDNMNKEKSREVLGKIFDRHFNEKEEFEKIYLDKQEISKMKEKGMEIGSHAHNHDWLGRLYYKDMEEDLRKSVNAFEKAFSEKPLTISYPFGSYTTFTKKLAEELGFIAGVTTIKGINLNLDKPLELKRFDCIDFFPRKTIEETNTAIEKQEHSENREHCEKDAKA